MPVLSVSFNDLTALRSVILGYLSYARRSIPPSWQRDAQIRLLESLHQRLVGMPSGSTKARIFLQKPEIQALNDALLVFTAFVRQKVSPSPERDETLNTLERLRQTLLQMLTTAP